MNDLTLSTNPLTFDELVELGRAAIPAIAPRWTDHNTHDPGVMLMELVAWIAEAQMYSIERLRRDERLAYARLLGITPRGPAPAAGLLWQSMAWPPGTVLPKEVRATPDYPAPSFRTLDPIELTAAVLARVRTVFASGALRDWTRANAQEGATFVPFGVAPARGDRLELSFQGDLVTGATPSACLSIGVDIDNASAPVSSPDTPPRLSVSLRSRRPDGRVLVDPLNLVVDSTGGLLTSGVLLVNLDDSTVRSRATDATIAIESATGGFLRSPRVRRIAFNVLRVQQLENGNETVEVKVATPGLSYQLQKTGLVFSDPLRAVQVTTTAGTTTTPWTCVRDLATSGPADLHFQLDASNRIVLFGNGVNGAMPPAESAVRFSYQLSAGTGGNLPGNASWSVQTLVGAFGTNRQAMSGGEDGIGLDNLRAAARTRSRTARPIVTTADLRESALSFTDLGVTRAIELPATANCPRVRGTRVLLVVGPHDLASGGSPSAEPAEFVEEVRRRLAPRLPLGQRLVVRGPRYVPVAVTATVISEDDSNPQAVQAAVVAELQRRLATALDDPAAEWPFGRDVALKTLNGWLRKVDGVAQVVTSTLSAPPSNVPVDRVQMGLADLPALQLTPTDITVERPAIGGQS